MTPDWEPEHDRAPRHLAQRRVRPSFVSGIVGEKEELHAVSAVT